MKRRISGISGELVYVKPENNVDPIVRPGPGTHYPEPQDGLVAQLSQVFRGSWKDADWVLKQHRDWMPLYCAMHLCRGHGQ